MATRLTYNGVTLHNVTTRDFRQDVFYDPSNTDKIGARVFISVEGVIHNQRVSGTDLSDGNHYVDPGGVSSSASTASIYDRLIRQLSEPRKTLKFSVGASSSVAGDSVLSIAPISIDPIGGDIDNGPKPQKVDITSIVGSAVFRVRFDIQAAIGLISAGQQGAVLSNRWSLNEAMDENFFTERRINGTLRLAFSTFGPSQAGGIPAHVHKWLCIPALEMGFKRRSIDFGVDADGLTCIYSVVDKQTHTAAPWPATKIDAKHTESMSDGVSFVSQVAIRLEGPPHVDKRLLIERAIQVAENRIDFTAEPSTGEVKQSIEYAEIVDNIGDDNAIELTIRLKQLRDAGEQFTRLLTGPLGSPLEMPAEVNYDPKLSAIPTLYGYDPHGGERRPAVLYMLHCYLQTPGSLHGINDNKITREGEDITDLVRAETKVTEHEPDVIAESQHQHYSETGKTALYTMSKIVSEYGVNEMRVPMPFSFLYPKVGISSTNVVLDLCEPQAWRRVEVDVERLGQPPELGTPQNTYRDNDLVATRLHHEICVFPPILSPDGRNPVYRVKASILYSLSRPPLAGEKLRIGVHPYTKDLASSLTLNNLFNQSLDPSPSSNPAPG